LSGKILYNIAWLKFANKKYSEALKYYKKARKLWNSTLVNFWIAKTYYIMGDSENALKYINITLRMDPKYYDAQKLKEKIK
jgi:tetratricopeptide (TPR) repeat protein